MAHTANRNLQVLIVGSDPSLEDEFRTALADVPDARAVLHFAETYRDALEMAGGRQPDLILIDIDREIREIVELSKELQELLPGGMIAGAFAQDRFENGSGGAVVIELLRADVRDFLRRPVSATELRAVLDRLFARKPSGAAGATQGRLVAWLSNKGGVGKSTLSVNVASALALRHPDEVLLVDASPQGGSCAAMLDLKSTTSIVDAIRERDRLDTTLLRQLTLKHGTGLRLLAAPADALEGADVNEEAVAWVLNLARRTFRYILVDTFPMVDGIVTTVLDMTDLALVVVQGTVPAAAGAARLLPVLEGLGLPTSRQRLVLNTTFPAFAGNLRPVDIADRLQRTIDYVVPYDKRIPMSMNTGVPQVLNATWWQPFRRAITQIVDDLEALGAGTGSVPGGGPAGRHGAGRREVRA